MRKQFFKIALFLISALLSMQSVVYAQQPKEKTMLVAISSSSVIVIDRVLYTALKRLGYDPVIERMETKTAINSVSVGDKHILGAVSGMSENSKGLIRVPEVISKSDCLVYIREGSGVVVDSWEDVRDLRVAYNWNQIYIENELQKYCDDPKRFNTSEKAFDALKNNEADAVVILEFDYADNIVPKGIVKANAFDSLAAYSYVNKDYAYLVPQLASAYKEMKEDGTLEKIKSQLPLKDKQEKIVLHISSYNADMTWENELVLGAKTGLKKHDEITYINLALNTRRQEGEELDTSIARYYLCDELLEKIPDVLIASDNDALNFVVANYSTLFVNIPIVFCGINEFDPLMLNGLDNYATGVEEFVSAQDTAIEISKLYPDAKKVLILNDYSLSGQKIRESIEADLKDYQGNLVFSYNEDVSISQLEEQIKSFGKDTVVLLGRYFIDQNGDYYSELDMSEMITGSSKNAFFTLYVGTFGLGTLGGKITNSYNHGATAAKIALNVLSGTMPSDIPIISDPSGINQWMFDYAVADKFNIDSNLFPSDSVVINKKLSIYESAPILVTTVISIIISIIIVAGTLCVFFIITRRRNRELIKIQKSLHTAEELLERDLIIKEIKNRLEKSIGSAPIGYVVTVEGLVVETNRYVDDHFGLRLSQPVREIFPDPVLRDVIQQELEEGKVISGRTVYLKTLKEGQQRFQLNYNSVAYANKTAFITWVVSVEEVEAQKDALSLAEKGLQKIVDTLPIPMLIVNKINHDILYANHASSYLFLSGDTEAADNRKLTDFVELYNQHKETLDSNINFEIMYTSQEEIDLLVSASEIVYRNDSSIIFICQNISAQKKQSEHLLKAAEKEREANQMKSVFLANMSHEIRTPMNAIIGFSQILISDKSLADKQKEFVQSINRSGEHLLTLINDVLEMSKIEAGSITLSLSTIDMHTMILEIKNMFQLRTNSKGISFLVEYDDLPRYIFSDESKIRQICINLLGNAVKFTNSGGLFWKFTCDDLQEQKLLIIEIIDTGIGIIPEELEHVFEPFKQSESGKSSGGGTGLGLSISRELARFMGGDITAESEYGVGATFHVEIPVEISDSYSVVEMETVQNVLSIKDGKNPKILVVDDKEENIQVLRELLGPVGFIIREARDGKEAIEVFENETLDLILMDMRMPIMDGYEASTKIRENTERPRIPIIALTASAFEEDKQRIFAIGIDDYVRKPFQRKTLFNAIKKNLDIEYIYEEDAVENVVIKDTEMSFDAVPIKLSESLAEAVNTADFNEALDVLDQMKDFLLAGEYNLIKSLIDSFQYEKVLEILDRTLLSDN